MFEPGGTKQESEDSGGMGEYHVTVDLPEESEGLREEDPDVVIMREELARERKLKRMKGEKR